MTAPKPTLKEKYSEPRSEVLAGGFIYEYPYFKDGMWHFPLNILKAAQYSINLDSETAMLLYDQVSSRELDFQRESLREKLEKRTEEQ